MGSSLYNVSLESLPYLVATEERSTVSDRNQPESAVTLSCARVSCSPQNGLSSCTESQYFAPHAKENTKIDEAEKRNVKRSRYKNGCCKNPQLVQMNASEN